MNYHEYLKRIKKGKILNINNFETKEAEIKIVLIHLY